MPRFEPGQRVGKYRNGRMVDRGEVLGVLEVEGAQVATIRYTQGGIFNSQRGDDIRVLRTVEGGIDFRELEAAGITEAAFRGREPHRRADHPWTISDDHQERLRPWLKANGFSAVEVIEAQESHDHDGFLLRQEYPLP